MGKNNKKKKVHTIRNKKAKKTRSNTNKNVSKTAKEDELMFTHAFVKIWPVIIGVYFLILLFRLLFAMINKGHINNYIKFILFFTIQYFGYPILILITIFCIELTKILFFKYILILITKLSNTDKVPDLFKFWPITYYVLFFLIPRLIVLMFYLLGIVACLLLILIFVVPAFIVLLGYTK